MPAAAALHVDTAIQAQADDRRDVAEAHRQLALELVDLMETELAAPAAGTSPIARPRIADGPAFSGPTQTGPDPQIARRAQASQLVTLLSIWLLQLRGDLPQIQAPLARAQQRFPQDPLVALALGSLHEAHAAPNALVEASAGRQGNLEKWRQEERAYRLEQALVAYRQAVALDPTLAEAHLRLGHVLLLTGKVDEADAAFARASAETGDRRWRYLAEMLRADGADARGDRDRGAAALPGRARGVARRAVAGPGAEPHRRVGRGLAGGAGAPVHARRRAPAAAPRIRGGPTASGRRGASTPASPRCAGWWCDEPPSPASALRRACLRSSARRRRVLRRGELRARAAGAAAAADAALPRRRQRRPRRHARHRARQTGRQADRRRLRAVRRRRQAAGHGGQHRGRRHRRRAGARHQPQRRRHAAAGAARRRVGAGAQPAAGRSRRRRHLRQRRHRQRAADLRSHGGVPRPRDRRRARRDLARRRRLDVGPARARQRSADAGAHLQRRRRHRELAARLAGGRARLARQPGRRRRRRWRGPPAAAAAPIAAAGRGRGVRQRAARRGHRQLPRRPHRRHRRVGDRRLRRIAPRGRVRRRAARVPHQVPAQLHADRRRPRRLASARGPGAPPGCNAGHDRARPGYTQ